MSTREAAVVHRLCGALLGLALASCGGQASLPPVSGMSPATGPALDFAPLLSAPPSPEERSHISSVHLAKCGSCHTPVAPGSRLRLEVEAALGRHRKRARLTDREWHLMIEYLTNDKEALSASASITPPTNGISR